MCFLERQLPLAVALAQACDNTQLILDHCGVPDIASGNPDAWKRNISQLAALPHVHCKLSGVIAYCPQHKPLKTSIQPYIEHCIEAFGWDRLVWGSDWPVCNLRSDLSTWATVFRELLAAESADVRNAVSMNNAQGIYGVKP
jgi:predicted TIM-barrel fold metal-dependent hydrolase